MKFVNFEILFCNFIKKNYYPPPLSIVYIEPPTHGILTPLHMVYRPPYPWYIDPPTHGISNPPNHGISTPLPMVY